MFNQNYKTLGQCLPTLRGRGRPTSKKEVTLSIFEEGKTLMLDEGFLSSGGGNTVK